MAGFASVGLPGTLARDKEHYQGFERFMSATAANEDIELVPSSLGVVLDIIRFLASKAQDTEPKTESGNPQNSRSAAQLLEEIAHNYDGNAHFTLMKCAKDAKMGMEVFSKTRPFAVRWIETIDVIIAGCRPSAITKDIKNYAAKYLKPEIIARLEEIDALVGPGSISLASMKESHIEAALNDLSSLIAKIQMPEGMRYNFELHLNEMHQMLLNAKHVGMADFWVKYKSTAFEAEVLIDLQEPSVKKSAIDLMGEVKKFTIMGLLAANLAVSGSADWIQHYTFWKSPDGIELIESVKAKFVTKLITDQSESGQDTLE